MMQYRGSDDDVVGFGHFSEVRKVKAGPADVVAIPSGKFDPHCHTRESPRPKSPAKRLVLYQGYL